METYCLVLEAVLAWLMPQKAEFSLFYCFCIWEDWSEPKLLKFLCCHVPSSCFAWPNMCKFHSLPDFLVPVKLDPTQSRVTALETWHTRNQPPCGHVRWVQNKKVGWEDHRILLSLLLDLFLFFSAKIESLNVQSETQFRTLQTSTTWETDVHCKDIGKQMGWLTTSNFQKNASSETNIGLPFVSERF